MKQCSVCAHPLRNQIDESLLLSSASLRVISQRFGPSPSALSRHKLHIPSNLAQAKMASEICNAEKILTNLLDLKSVAARITRRAEDDNDLKTALIGVRTQYNILEILGKIHGNVQQPQIDLSVNNITLIKIHARLSRKVEAINETNR